MLRWIAMLVVALPAAAEWLSLELTFQGTGCTSCVESLPARILRTRGVQSAEVDAARGVLRAKLAGGNRVRLELLRDQVEQDGTKVTEAQVNGAGVLEYETDTWVFKPDGQSVAYRIEGVTLRPGKHAVLLTAASTALRPEVTLRAVGVKPRE